VDEALAVLKRHGYTAGDLDFLLYEGQGSTPGDDDPELRRSHRCPGPLERARAADRLMPAKLLGFSA
jgi:hypothetical protein